LVEGKKKIQESTIFHGNNHGFHGKIQGFRQTFPLQAMQASASPMDFTSRRTHRRTLTDGLGALERLQVANWEMIHLVR